MYRFAYSAICEEPPSPAQPSHSAKLSDAAELIETAGRACLKSHEELQLLSDFCRLWLAIVSGLPHAGQESAGEPPETLLLAAKAVLPEVERWRFAADNPPYNQANAQVLALLQ